MSYILEALKKSQQERELGQVPTLEANLSPNESQALRGPPWGLAAVTLAALAVVIALYAAFRGQPTAPLPSVPKPDGQVSRTAPVTAKAVAPPAAPSAPASAPATPAAPAEPKATGAPGAAPSGRGATAAAVPAPKPITPESIIPPRPSPPIPEDIRADIEAFKKQVREERSGGASTVKAKPAAPPKAPVRPEDLRLPPDVEERLPAFFMTVHVYDKDPAKRFVGINSVKSREGDRTPEGLTVEKILPDGAVLSFEGHKFFRHR
jgi:general secretion pathway protein B